MQISLSDIKVNKRIRESAGDLTDLQKSMDTIGLLHPIIIDHENNLIAGFRRLQAAKTLGWSHIEAAQVEVNDEKHRLLLESQENTTRLDFTSEELKDIKDLLHRYRYHSLLGKLWAWLAYMCKKLLRHLFK